MSGLEFFDISKRFGGIMAVTGVTGAVGRGEFVGLIGPNGAGKSTLVNMVGGSFPPSAGRILLDGTDITSFSAHRRARLGIFRTYQTPRLFRRLSVTENIQLAARTSRRGGGAEAVKELIATLGLEPSIGQPVDSLNIVSRHRIEIARCLLAEPALLLLDEVTAGMSAEDSEETLALVHSWQERLGFGVLFIEHNLKLVSEWSSRLIVLNFGACISSGPTAEVLQNADVVAAYMGMGA